MRLYKYLTEKWIKSFKDRDSFGRIQDKIIEVFVNPTKSEFRDASGNTDFDALSGKYVRFFADMKKKQVYIWNPESIHEDTWKEFGDGRRVSDETLLSGVAQIKKGKWTFMESDEGVRRNLKNFDVEDWEWANKWINVTDHLEEFKKTWGL
jgi:hypothetical protein